MSDTVDMTTVYRDSTYSAWTQANLKGLLTSLEILWGADNPDIEALRDVIDRWDANDATETVFV